MKIYRVFLPFLMVFLPFACSAQDDILVEDDEEEQPSHPTATERMTSSS